jgi:tetratricopeptide (TPR) repeat protein
MKWLWAFLNLTFPRTGDHHAAKGIVAYRAGDHADAIGPLKKALGRKLRKFARDEVATILGNAHCELNQFEAAVKAHLQALKANRRSHSVWVNLGVANRLLNRLDEAERCYSQALMLKPDYAEAHSSLGALHVIRKRPEQAIVSLNHAERLDGSVGSIPANLAIALALVGLHHEAQTALNRAESIGYPNVAAGQKRINDLMNKDEDFDPLDIGKHHLICPRCECEILSHPDEDETGRPIACPECGNPMKVLGPS